MVPAWWAQPPGADSLLHDDFPVLKVSSDCGTSPQSPSPHPLREFFFFIIFFSPSSSCFSPLVQPHPQQGVPRPCPQQPKPPRDPEQHPLLQWPLFPGKAQPVSREFQNPWLWGKGEIPRGPQSSPAIGQTGDEIISAQALPSPKALLIWHFTAPAASLAASQGARRGKAAGADC